MNNRKFYYLPMILLILIMSCMMIFTSCGDSKVTDIAVTGSNQPRLTYVQGQELDLSKGSITVLVAGKETQVPLDAEGVTVSGYDKNTLGKQTLTITYLDKTTTFDVNVIARITAESYEKNYFVGDSINLAKGKLKIAKDNGTVSTVNFNNPNISVKSFDSSTAGEKKVTISYTDEVGSVYEIDINVNVYNIGEITLTKPSKVSYFSHDTQLSLSGGYLTVKADGLDSLAKFVDITADMVTGFDPTVATLENRDTPVEQTLTVTYAGKSVDFKITIIYSSISIIKDSLAIIKDEQIDFSGVITPEQSAAIFDAATEYFNLTQAKKNEIEYEDVTLLARASTLHIMSLFAREVLANQDVFIINDSGNIILNRSSYERAKEIGLMLNDKNSNFNVYAKLLRNIKGEFGSFKVDASTQIADYVVVPTAEHVHLYVEVLKLISNLHEALKDVPDDWTLDNLGNYSKNITSSVQLIIDSGCFGPDYNHVYNLLNSWRTNQDYFEIIYKYYYNIAENGHDFIVSNLWMKVPLPGRLQDWYTSLYNAIYQAQFMTVEKAYMYDTTTFMYSFFETYKLAEEIKNGDNEFYKGLYTVLNGDLMMDVNIRKANGGYIFLSNSMMNSVTFLDLWDKYLHLISLVGQGNMDFNTYDAEFKAVFDAFNKLSPSETAGFISSLHYLYMQSGGNQYVFDFSKQANDRFIFCMANYLFSKLPESARPAVQHLFTAIESYALHCTFGEDCNALDIFKKAITDLTNVYNSLTPADAAIFDSVIGDCYTKHVNIYKCINGTFEFEMGEWEAKIDELLSTMNTYFKVNDYIVNPTTPEEQRKTTLILLLGIYERIEEMYLEIMNSGNESVITAMYAKVYDVEGSNVVPCIAMTSANAVCMNYLLTITFTSTDSQGQENAHIMWDIYDPANIEDFMKKMSLVLQARFENAPLSLSVVLDAMEAYRALSTSDKNTYEILGANYYYDTLSIFFASTVNQEYEKAFGTDNLDTAVKNSWDNTLDYAKSLLAVERLYLIYQNNTNNEEAYANFTNAMKSLIELHDSIAVTDIRDIVFGTIYDYYVEMYQTVTAG